LGNTFCDQQRSEERRVKLGLPSVVTGEVHSTDQNVARLERVRDLELNNLNLSAAEDAKIRALDLSTAEGRKAFLAEQRSLEQRIESGAFKGAAGNAALGGFANVDELANAVDEAASGLAAFADATAQATKNLSNVPDLRTLAEEEFRARSAFGTNEGPNDGSRLPIFPTLPTDPNRLRGIDFTPPIPAPGISESRVSLDTTARAQVADPITAALGKLGGGATLQDLLVALSPATQRTGTPLPASRVINVFGAVNVNVQGVPTDPAATARAVRAEFLTSLLATDGREDL
jgi:hypothetical protein